MRLGGLRCVRFVALIGAFAFFAAAAEDARTVAWDDLSVKVPASENPFTSLSIDDLSALGSVAAVRGRRGQGLAITPAEATLEQEARATLRRHGIDADALLAKRDAIAARMRAATRAVNPALDGRNVHLAGYVLPLEFAGKQVSEFLLVPWVGACIHTPPPEPNQIVYVKPDKPFEIDGIYEAVWVTGRLRTTASTKSVQIVDGSSDVDVGYALRADVVERYRP